MNIYVSFEYLLDLKVRKSTIIIDLLIHVLFIKYYDLFNKILSCFNLD